MAADEAGSGKPAKPSNRGRFITFEGGEGVGKSTQIPLLADHLRQRHGLTVVETREPGGTQGAEAIRGLLVEGAVDRWSAMTECLLHFAARGDHVERVIRPALARGDWVICDRFVDSTMAYQGIAGGVGRDTVALLANRVLGGLMPDLTVLLDAPVTEGLTRAKGRNSSEMRYEEFDLTHHEIIRNSFLEIAASEPGRVRRIDVHERSIRDVAANIVSVVEERIIYD